MTQIDPRPTGGDRQSTLWLPGSSRPRGAGPDRVDSSWRACCQLPGRRSPSGGSRQGDPKEVSET